MQPFPLWSPAASWFTLQWDEVSRRPLPPPPGVIPTPRPPHVSPSSLWSAFPPVYGILPIPLPSPLSPPRSHFCTGVTKEPAPYTSSPGPAPFLMPVPLPSQSFPAASAPSTRFRYTANHLILLYAISIEKGINCYVDSGFSSGWDQVDTDNA